MCFTINYKNQASKCKPWLFDCLSVAFLWSLTGQPVLTINPSFHSGISSTLLLLVVFFFSFGVPVLETIEIALNSKTRTTPSGSNNYVPHINCHFTIYAPHCSDMTVVKKCYS